MSPAKKPGTRTPRGPMSPVTRRWLIRGAVAALAGVVIGGAGGVITVRTLEPGRANAVDSVQAVLDSLARGTIPEPTADERAQESKRRSDSTSKANTADSIASDEADVLLPVPEVVGLEEGSARDKLLDAGLLVGEVQFRASSSPPGIVLATNPPAGSLLASSSTVALVISDGRSPADTLTPQLHPVP